MKYTCDRIGPVGTTGWIDESFDTADEAGVRRDELNADDPKKLWMVTLDLLNEIE